MLLQICLVFQVYKCFFHQPVFFQEMCLSSQIQFVERIQANLVDIIAAFILWSNHHHMCFGGIRFHKEQLLFKKKNHISLLWMKTWLCTFVGALCRRFYTSPRVRPCCRPARITGVDHVWLCCGGKSAMFIDIMRFSFRFRECRGAFAQP